MDEHLTTPFDFRLSPCVPAADSRFARIGIDETGIRHGGDRL